MILIKAILTIFFLKQICICIGGLNDYTTTGHKWLLGTATVIQMFAIFFLWA